MLEKERKEVVGVNRLYRKMCIITLCTTYVLGIGGCLENAVSDIGGWDVSACVDGFSTCFELFRDNADKFAGGFSEALGGIQ